MMIVNYILIGIMLGILDIVGIKYSVKKMVSSGNHLMSAITLFFRLLIFAILFYIFMARDWRKAILMLIGLTLVELFFILFTHKKMAKKK